MKNLLLILSLVTSNYLIAGTGQSKPKVTPMIIQSPDNNKNYRVTLSTPENTSVFLYAPDLNTLKIKINMFTLNYPGSNIVTIATIYQSSSQNR